MTKTQSKAPLEHLASQIILTKVMTVQKVLEIIQQRIKLEVM
jgi:hypothetical protein